MNQQNNSQSDTLPTISLCIDWISATAKKIPENIAYSSFPLLHDWENWQVTNGTNGYTVGAKHTTGCKAYFNPNREDMGVHTVYSGNVLRRIEEMSGDNGTDVLRYHVLASHSIARVDVALDFKDTGLKVSDFQDQYEKGKCLTRLKTASVVKSITDSGHTFYIGSQKTRKKLVRIYDKGAEQNTDEEWIRVELQLMGKPATTASQYIINAPDIKTAMITIIKSVADFPMLEQWVAYTQDVETIKIGSQSNEKGDTREWLLKQVIPSLARECMLDNEFWIEFQTEALRRISFLQGSG